MAAGSDSLRLFVALPIPAGVRERLASQQRELAAGGMPVRWTRPEGMHLTLVFLGQTPPALVQRIEGVLQAAAVVCRPLRLAVRGVGCFPGPSRPRVLWAGLDGDVVDLAALQRGVAEGVSALGVTVEARDFRPHVTLGRATGPLERSAERLLRVKLGEAVDFGAWTAETVELVRSELRREGSVYTTLCRAPLGGAPHPPIPSLTAGGRGGLPPAVPWPSPAPLSSRGRGGGMPGGQGAGPRGGEGRHNETRRADP